MASQPHATRLTGALARAASIAAVAVLALGTAAQSPPPKRITNPGRRPQPPQPSQPAPSQPAPPAAPPPSPSAPAPASPPAGPAPSRPQAPSAQPPAPAPRPAAPEPNVNPIGPGVGQPGSAGSPPVIQPITIQGQRAPTPFYWGPTVGTYTPRRDGIIPGPYTPMGVPAVLTQPPRYAPPGSPDRQQDLIAQGPRPGAIAGDYPILRPVPNSRPPATSPRLDTDPITHQRDLLICIRDGITIKGRIEGDKYRIGFTIGGHPFLIDRFGFAHDINRGGYCYRGYGSWGAAYPYYYNYGYGYWHSPVYGVLATIDPATADPFLTQPMNPAGAPAPAPPAIDESVLPNVERGHLALQRGQTTEAVAFYRAHVAVESGDADALRYLAVALFEAREFPEAAAVMILAYSTDPELAGLPLIASRFPQGERGLADRVTRATGVANSSRTASAYLFAAVLAQAHARPDVARRLIDKARAAGLHRQIDAAFARTRNPPAPAAHAPRAPAK